jgi:hypothetical protein
MTYSHTQISRYLRCPKSYRYRYLDGWTEKDSRAPLLFGRCFEKALAAFFSREDSAAVLFNEWGKYQYEPLKYSPGDSWERLLRQGVTLLETLAHEDRIHIGRPQQGMQVKLTKPLANGNQFIAYVDALGTLDGNQCLLEWKTTSARYPDEPDGLLSLDPQLVCYSWMSGIADVSLIAFVRKRVPEIQYLKTKITDKQRQEYGNLVESTVGQIEAGQFPAHSGIRFPQNGCLSCDQLGLCLGNEELVTSKLTRRPGASELDCLEHLDE